MSPSYWSGPPLLEATSSSSRVAAKIAHPGASTRRRAASESIFCGPGSVTAERSIPLVSTVGFPWGFPWHHGATPIAGWCCYGTSGMNIWDYLRVRPFLETLALSWKLGYTPNSNGLIIFLLKQRFDAICRYSHFRKPPLLFLCNLFREMNVQYRYVCFDIWVLYLDCIRSRGQPK